MMDALHKAKTVPGLGETGANFTVEPKLALPKKIGNCYNHHNHLI
jgi:hypothetical protein